MSHRLLRVLVAIGINAAAIVSAPAQPIAGADAATAIRHASALGAAIGGYHRGPASWRGLGPPPPGYCGTMRAGEALLQELARMAGTAAYYRQSGLTLSLEKAGDRLGDELDEEVEINLAGGVGYVEYPCPAPTAYPGRAAVLAPIDQRAPACRRHADARLVSFNARRMFMKECLRL